MSKQVFESLENLKIPFKQVSHDAVESCEGHDAAINKLDLSGIVLAKNLFIKNKKTKKKALLVMPSSKNLNFALIGQLIGMNGKHLRFCDEETLNKVLKSSKGSVNPLSIIFDTENEVEVIIDNDLKKSDKQIGVHPMDNSETIFLSPNHLDYFLKSHNHQPRYVDLVLNPKQTNGDKNGSPVKKPGKKGQMPKRPNRDERGITVTRQENFGKWYSEVVIKAEMIEYYDISGCYVLRPNSCFIWNRIKDFFTREIEKLGVEEAYFPMFVSKSALEAEKDHIEGFSPEVAWVTRSGSKELSQPIAIRPTSETIMYPIFRNWIRSHRDLPIRLNQWTNVVRWEFKNPTPFIRTREFLWQEGHGAFASKDKADEEVFDILDLYSEIYENLLAVPVIKGVKTSVEKFPGADYTTTVEAFIPDTGRAIQGGTSHSLGQTFGKIFDIEFEDEEEKKKIPYQNSWGFSSRSIGVMIMTHGDDKGLIVPPKVAKTQIVVVPIQSKYSDDERAKFRAQYMDIANTIRAKGMRVHVDERINYKPGWKYNYWELQGVPLRIEFGPKDAEKEQCVFVRRDTGEKIAVKIHLAHTEAEKLLVEIQDDMYKRAKERFDDRRVTARTWQEFLSAISKNCYAEVPFCNTEECEKSVKKRTKGSEENVKADADSTLSGSAKSLCIPIIQSKKLDPEMKCFACDSQATKWALFGRSY